MAISYIRVCKACGNSFWTTNPDKEYCRKCS